MKKIFLAAAMALAFSSYSYAYDYDEYEKDEAPARVVKKAPVIEDEDEDDDAASSEDKKSGKFHDGEPIFGIGLDVTGILVNQSKINATFRIGNNMALTAMFGFWRYGETTHKVLNQEQDQHDDNTTVAIGVGFDYYPIQELIPISIGTEFVYNSLAQTEWINDNRIDINLLAGVHAELVKNLVLSGKAGLALQYHFGDNDATDPTYTDVNGNAVKVEYSRMDLGIAYKIYLTWFVI